MGVEYKYLYQIKNREIDKTQMRDMCLERISVISGSTELQSTWWWRVCLYSTCQTDNRSTKPFEPGALVSRFENWQYPAPFAWTTSKVDCM